MKKAASCTVAASLPLLNRAAKPASRFLRDERNIAQDFFILHVYRDYPKKG
jgi:hypothetical protein